MRARPLNVPKIMYIFQLMFQSSGGTPKARMQFQSQLEAVERETAFARTLAGKISEGYVCWGLARDVPSRGTNTYPGGGTPGGGEAGYEKVGAGNHALGDALVAHDAPRGVLVGVIVGLAVGGLQSAGDEQPGHHEERAGEESGTTTEAVEVEDGGEGHDHVDDVLDG